MRILFIILHLRPIIIKGLLSRFGSGVSFFEIFEICKFLHRVNTVVTE